MINVIKHGKFTELGPVTCQHCECEFTYSILDVLAEQTETFGPIMSYLRCPECRTIIFLPRVDLEPCVTPES